MECVPVRQEINAKPKEMWGAVSTQWKKQRNRTDGEKTDDSLNSNDLSGEFLARLMCCCHWKLIWFPCAVLLSFFNIPVKKRKYCDLWFWICDTWMCQLNVLLHIVLSIKVFLFSISWEEFSIWYEHNKILFMILLSAALFLMIPLLIRTL